MSDPSLVALPPEEKLKAIAERLRDKVADWRDYNDGGWYYSDEEAAAADGKKYAYDQAADDLEWVLRAFGLEKA
jgi:hypothetical protein